MFFAPANPDAKLNARFRVSVFPEADTEDAPALIVHWLLLDVPVLPITKPACQTPASLASETTFEERVKDK
jgi:hypothetical protein